MTLIAATAVGGFVFVFTSPKQDDIAKLPAAIEAVYPPGGNLDLRQVTIAADLVPGYKGILELDGVELPLDQQQFVLALNTVTFRPDPNGDYGEIAPGPHCATLRYSRIDRPTETPSTYRWCFSLH